MIPEQKQALQEHIQAIVNQLAPDVQIREALDWFYLIENLHKVGGPLKRLKQAQDLLWKGQLEATIALFTNCKGKQAQNFCHYLNKHRDAFGRLRLRIINHEYHQAEQRKFDWFWVG